METQTTNFENAQFTKVTVKQIDAPKDKKGWTLIGYFEEFRKTPFKRVRNGELLDLEFKQLILTNSAGEKEAYPCDMGLYQAIGIAGIKPGELIKCVNLGKTTMKNGQTLNQWDVLVSRTNH